MSFENGYGFSDSSDSSDDSKSILDEDYYTLQPPPIRIWETNRKIIIVNNHFSASNTNDSKNIPNGNSATSSNINRKNNYPQKKSYLYSNSVHVLKNKRYSAGRHMVARKRNFGKTNFPQRNFNCQKIPSTSCQRNLLVNTVLGDGEIWDGSNLFFTNSSNQLQTQNLWTLVENKRSLRSINQTEIAGNVNQKQSFGDSSQSQDSKELMKGKVLINTTNGKDFKSASAKNVNRINKRWERNNCSNFNSIHAMKNKEYFANQQRVTNKDNLSMRNINCSQSFTSNQAGSVASTPTPAESVQGSLSCGNQYTQNHVAVKSLTQPVDKTLKTQNNVFEAKPSSSVERQNSLEHSYKISNQALPRSMVQQSPSGSNHSKNNQDLKKGEAPKTPNNVFMAKPSSSVKMQDSFEHPNEILNQPPSKSVVGNSINSVTNQIQSPSGSNHSENNQKLIKRETHKNLTDVSKVKTSSSVIEMPDSCISAEQHAGVVIRQPIIGVRNVSNQEQVPSITRPSISNSENTSKTFCDRFLDYLFCMCDNNYSSL